MKIADFDEYILFFQTADWLPPIYPKVSFEKTYFKNYIMDQFRCFPISTNHIHKLRSFLFRFLFSDINIYLGDF